MPSVGDKKRMQQKLRRVYCSEERVAKDLERKKIWYHKVRKTDPEKMRKMLAQQAAAKNARLRRNREQWGTADLPYAQETLYPQRIYLRRREARDYVEANGGSLFERFKEMNCLLPMDWRLAREEARRMGGRVPQQSQPHC